MGGGVFVSNEQFLILLFITWKEQSRDGLSMETSLRAGSLISHIQTRRPTSSCAQAVKSFLTTQIATLNRFSSYIMFALAAWHPHSGLWSRLELLVRSSKNALHGAPHSGS